MNIQNLINLAQEKGCTQAFFLFKDKQYLNLATIQKWLREKHEMWVYVRPKTVIDQVVWVNNLDERTAKNNVQYDAMSHSEWKGYQLTYEAALAKGLELAIKFLKSKKDNHGTSNHN